ncbi:uncharacterized protein TNCV_2506381 [Trichonephila clavipes]|uniref:SCAN box domain-containing protein n=1 Tax=Trichonephila clavipes TaxID=2585209 RepID=A0A8X7BK98_TRICX|nr:uncharacterized protein TNCV_2506381 [Trichonephila clavipes]
MIQGHHTDVLLFRLALLQFRLFLLRLPEQKMFRIQRVIHLHPFTQPQEWTPVIAQNTRSSPMKAILADRNVCEEHGVWTEKGSIRQIPAHLDSSTHAKGRRQDLLELAETLDISIPDNLKILDIKDAILNSEGYDPEFTCECLNRIISDRKELELRDEREKENQRQFELQKLQFTIDTSTTADSNMPKLELHKLLPIFDPKTTDVTIFLDLFERQLTFLKVPVPQWVVYLVGLLPTEVSNLIAKESVVDAQDYYKVKQILLKRFKLSAEKFRQMFSRHSKDPVKTWRDFYCDLQTYFDGWLKESKVTTLEELKDLIVADHK